MNGPDFILLFLKLMYLTIQFNYNFFGQAYKISNKVSNNVLSSDLMTGFIIS